VPVHNLYGFRFAKAKSNIIKKIERITQHEDECDHANGFVPISLFENGKQIREKKFYNRIEKLCSHTNGFCFARAGIEGGFNIRKNP
jgi:hypothetical protein